MMLIFWQLHVTVLKLQNDFTSKVLINHGLYKTVYLWPFPGLFLC